MAERTHEAKYVGGELVEITDAAERAATRRILSRAAEVGAILAGLYVVVQATLLGVTIYAGVQKADAIEKFLVNQLNGQRVAATSPVPPAVAAEQKAAAAATAKK